MAASAEFTGKQFRSILKAMFVCSDIIWFLANLELVSGSRKRPGNPGSSSIASGEFVDHRHILDHAI
jgi:hypothetical protein